MGILSAGAAQALAGTIEMALPDVAAITRVTRTLDATTGGWSETTATYASGIPCRVDKSGLTPRERAIAERYGSVQTFNVMLSALATRWPGGAIDLRPSDRIVITGEAAGTFEPAESHGPVTDQLVVEIVAVKIS
jgi:hypothetical protein